MDLRGGFVGDEIQANKLAWGSIQTDNNENECASAWKESSVKQHV